MRHMNLCQQSANVNMIAGQPVMSGTGWQKPAKTT